MPTAGSSEIECPFCYKLGVKAIHRSGYMGHVTSRNSTGSKVTYHRVPESYDIQSGCPSCGKTKKEIQEAVDGKAGRHMDPQKAIERLKQSGLPTRFESKPR